MFDKLLFTVFLFFQVQVLVQHSVLAATNSANRVAHGLFKALSVCGPGADPMSDIVNMSSISAIEKTTFADYVTHSVPMTFENSNNSAISGSAADSEWKSFLPSNNGFLSKEIANDTVLFGISAFHAMHCLDTMRRILEVHYDVASADTVAKIQASAIYGSFYHIHHCLIYLREMVVCNADPALEHDIYYENGTAVFGGDGTNHTCRDFKALYDISEESDEAARTGCGLVAQIP
ncbi:hypothetical protein K435DRAFT_735926 [Dendrothele bispora CBS 962.96]|uniref:Uncharacterized protein n=1 Tax=Dendrothele bispora (strain CBS 962.96) TaxID=1314807 RepID=A0A4S8KXV3_DENBC|nr:hypothetical protein K435DRAFT_735926 [Dendrothele bispora CBS 962.96]